MADRYSIIYADPPWQFKNYSDQWHTDHPESKWVGKQYGLMSLTDVMALPVEDIAADDAVLFMWCTMPTIQDAFKVIKAWGFTYKTAGFVWVKQSKTGRKEHVGMGFWTRSNAEVCLLATRGKPKRLSKSVRQIVTSPVRKHSEKPDEVRDRIVELLGDLPRIELFARKHVDGWDAWGDEVKPDIVLEPK